MLRKRAIAAALVAVGASLLVTPGAQAAPTELTVRIEGREKTLFEGPILTEGHAVQASGDTEPRTCDGTNNSAHPQPGPTPTASSVDAMELVGQTFGADWFPGYDDYYVERWGPDMETFAEGGKFWGVLVNGVLTPVGGCQWADKAGDEVLWVYDAFSGRRLLWLAAASDPATAPQKPLPTAHVVVNQPLALEVMGYIGAEGASAEVQPAAGVTVGPVTTDPGTGFQDVDTAAPSAATTAGDGSASVTFATPGWHRIKAQKEAGFIRSNRLDVCVEATLGAGCGPLPEDAALRVPSRYQPPVGPVDPGGTPARPAPETPKPPPSNALTLRGTAIDAGKGVAGLEVSVPGPGTLVVSGVQVLRRTIEAGAAGTVTLSIKPKAKARKALRRQGRLRTTVAVAFTPVGGVTASVQRTLTLRLAGGA
ncbi:MAG TPA: hypothetical protein VFJ57_06500 [Solirubrobacterales bacterium]|nr:hypothetical protein [Solirubrobacterales bacterium]